MEKSRPSVALIEDEPLVRVPLAYALQEAGYQVISGANGPEALDLLEDPSIGVAVLDIQLPGRMNGVHVAREATRRNTALKVILTSGGRPAEDISQLGCFLPKPFKASELIELIRSLLGAKTG